MTADEQLRATIEGLTDGQLRATWDALTAKPCKIPRDERLILNPRIMDEMSRRGLR